MIKLPARNRDRRDLELSLIAWAQATERLAGNPLVPLTLQQHFRLRAGEVRLLVQALTQDCRHERDREEQATGS